MGFKNLYSYQIFWIYIVNKDDLDYLKKLKNKRPK